MTQIAETRVPVMLDKERYMLFNANTMVAYEEATGKFFLDTVASLYDALQPVFEARARKKAGAEEDDNANVVIALRVMRRVPIRELRALLWASLHEYNAQGEPFWPLTIAQVGRLLKPGAVLPIFTSFMRGQSANAPTKEEMGESQALPETAAASAPTADSTGEPSIDLPVDAFV